MRILNGATVAIVALLCSWGCDLFAQPGIRAGVSAATLAIAEDEGRPFFGREIDWLIWGKAPGLHLGGFYRVSLTGRTGLLMELSYVRRGLSGDTSFFFDDIDYRVTLDYLEFPVPVTVTLPIWSSLDAIIKAGPYGAMLLQAHRQSRIDGIPERVNLANARRLDYGWMVGFGPSVSVRGRTIMADLRYYHGLANVMDPMEGSVAVSGESGSVKTRAFSMLVGITL